MRIASVTISNVRQFRKASFQFHRGFNLLIGENGVGKSTILRSILAALGSRQYYPSGKLGFSMEDINLRGNELHIEVRLTDERKSERTLTYSRDTANQFKRAGRKSDIPLLYYPSNESLTASFKPKKPRKVDLSTTHELIDIDDFLYQAQRKSDIDISSGKQFGRSSEIRDFVLAALSKLSPKFKDFAWRFEAYDCTMKVRDEGEQNLAKQRKMRKLLSNLLLRHFRKNPEILADVDMRVIHIDSEGHMLESGSPLVKVSPTFRELLREGRVAAFTRDGDKLESESIEVRLSPRIIVVGEDGSLPLAQLSDGETRLFSLFVDIARVLSLTSDAPVSETSAIVLIDEIDVHLHPKWQRTVVTSLEDLFPSCQFIATTHSPFVIQSVERRKVQEATTDGGKGIGAGESNSIEDIVEDVQDIEMPQRGKRAEELHKAAKRYFSLLRSDSPDSEELKAAESAYREASEPFSSNPALNALLQVEKTIVDRS